jgi:hypothetical protein
MVFPWRFLAIVALTSSFLSGSLFVMVNNDKEKTRFLLFFTLLAAILYLNLPHARPEKIYPVRDSDYTPDKIVQSNLTTTAKGECEPVWMKKRPAAPFTGRATLLKGDAAVTEKAGSTARHLFEVHARDASQLRITIAYFPGWKAVMDGNELRINYDNEEGLIDVIIPPGIHTLEVVFNDTPARAIGKALSLFGIILIVALAFCSGWREGLFQDMGD